MDWPACCTRLQACSTSDAVVIHMAPRHTALPGTCPPGQLWAKLMHSGWPLALPGVQLHAACQHMLCLLDCPFLQISPRTAAQSHHLPATFQGVTAGCWHQSICWPHPCAPMCRHPSCCRQGPQQHTQRQAASTASVHVASSTVPQVINAAALHCSATEERHGDPERKHNR
jgi:hypothetical protein